MRSTFPRSGVLVLGPNSIQSLVPSTLISQIESLLGSHRIEDAIDVADRRRKKLRENVAVDEDEADELRYVYQRIGFQCFTETLFKDAGRNFLNGDLDPRLLVSYYPELRGSLFNVDDVIDVFAGVAERMPTEASVDDIVRNYSPHLSPNTRSAPPTAELRKILGTAAKEMLEVFLTKCRTRRSVGGEEGKKIFHFAFAVVDTVLAKLYAEFGKTEDLDLLLREPNHIVVSELESILTENKQYNALCTLYKQHGDDLKLLEMWSKLIEGKWKNEGIMDPISDMVSLLVAKRDTALTQRWGLWLTKRDPERGLKLLMPRDTGKRKDRPDEDLALLTQIRDANPVAGAQFLEYLVLQRRSSSRELHTQLALSCIQQASAFLATDSVSRLWHAKASSYASSPSRTSFLSYFASTTPDSEHRHARLKMILFLAGSSLYDPLFVLPYVLEHRSTLTLELAIIDGKACNHRSALSRLVHDLHDVLSAEAYCTLGGHIVPANTAQSIAIAETGIGEGLQLWVSALFGSSAEAASVGKSKSRGSTAKPVPLAVGRQANVDAGLKRELLKILLEVYMNDDDEEASTSRAAQLLESQAINLDALDVIPAIPANWPLSIVSSFLERSFRRSLHARHEGKIVKTVSAGQNLEIKDRAWLILREEGMIVEEAVDGENEGDGMAYDEKQAFTEKLSMHLSSLTTTAVAHTNSDPGGEGGKRGEAESGGGLGEYTT